jgi:hypothetical protein
VQDFAALEPLFLVLKTLLADKSLDNPYTGGDNLVQIFNDVACKKI